MRSKPLANADRLLACWGGPEETPDFAHFSASDFITAFDMAIALAREEIAKISENPEPPTFENTVAALERSAATLARLRRIFWLLSSAQSDEGIRSIEADVSAKLTSYGTEVSQNGALFARVKAVWKQRGELSPEQARLVERSYKGFVTSGAGLEGTVKDRLAQIDAQLSALSVQFGQNVLAETNACELVIEKPQLSGIPADLRAAARGLSGRYTFSLDRGVFEALLTFADDRLKKFQYELQHPSSNKHPEMLNALMNGYVGCVDDATDLMQLGVEKQENVRAGIDTMVAKTKEFLEILNKIFEDKIEFDIYKDNLNDAIEGTRDAMNDAEKAKKAVAPPPVRRKN